MTKRRRPPPLHAAHGVVIQAIEAFAEEQRGQPYSATAWDMAQAVLAGLDEAGFEVRPKQ